MVQATSHKSHCFQFVSVPYSGNLHMNEYDTLLPPAQGIGAHFYRGSWKVKFKHFILHNGQGGKSPRDPTSPGLRSSHLHITEPKLTSSSANIIDVSELAGRTLDPAQHESRVAVPASPPTVNPRTSSLYSFDSFQQTFENHKRNTLAQSADTIQEKTSHSSLLTAVDFQQENTRRIGELESDLKAAKEEISELKQVLQAEKERSSFLCQKIYDQHSGYSAEKVDFVQVVAEYKQAIRRLKEQKAIDTTHAPRPTERKSRLALEYLPTTVTRRSQNGFPHSVPIQESPQATVNVTD